MCALLGIEATQVDQKNGVRISPRRLGYIKFGVVLPL